MSKFQSFIGEASQAYEAHLSAELLADFQHAVRSPGPSPMIWTRFREGEFELISRVGLELKQVLHAEQTYELRCAPVAGGTYRYVTKLQQVLEKASKSGPLHFFTFETEVFAAEETAVAAKALSTMVYREREIAG